MMEWVSVKTKKPEGLFLSDSFEVCDSRKGFCTLENNPFLIDHGWDGSFIEAFAWWGGRTCRVRFWQPLPSPPGEKE